MVYGPGYGPVYPRRIDNDKPKTRRYTVRAIDANGDEHLVTVNARSKAVAMCRARCQYQGVGKIYITDAWEV